MGGTELLYDSCRVRFGLVNRWPLKKDTGVKGNRVKIPAGPEYGEHCTCGSIEVWYPLKTVKQADLDPVEQESYRRPIDFGVIAHKRQTCDLVPWLEWIRQPPSKRFYAGSNPAGITIIRCGPIVIAMKLSIILSLFLLGALGKIASADCPSAGVPDDGLDDRLDIQSTLDTYGCVQLEPGTYTVSNDKLLGAAHVAALNISSGESLRGAGPTTVLYMYGDTEGKDVVGVQLSGFGSELSDLLVTTAGWTDMEEQSHAVQITGNATLGPAQSAVHGVWLDQTVRDARSGDCLRLLGEEGDRVSASVYDNVFLSCDRDGIEIQRGTYGLAVVDNLFLGVNKSDIDAEMTGTGMGGEWSITGNIFMSPDADVAISGTPATDVVFSDNVIVGGGFWSYSAQHLVVSGNIIISTFPGAIPIQMDKASDGAVITGNVLVRTATAGAGSVVYLSHHNSGYPQRTIVSENVIEQDGTGTGINITTISDVAILGNDIIDSGTGIAYGIGVTGIIAVSQDVTVEGNNFRGWNSGVSLSGNYLGVDRATVVGNTGTGMLYGLRCAAGTGVLTHIVSAANNWSTSVCTMATAGN